MMLAKCCKFLNYLSNSWLDFAYRKFSESRTVFGKPADGFYYVRKLQIYLLQNYHICVILTSRRWRFLLSAKGIYLISFISEAQSIGIGAQDLDDAGLAAAIAVGSLGEVAVGEVMDVADVCECDAVAVLADDLSNIVDRKSVV